MKNSTLLLTLISCIVINVNAQTLTESAFPVAGDVFTLTLCDTTGFQTGSSGSGVNWDFSGLLSNSTTQKDSFMAPSTTPYAALVNNATIAMYEVLPGSTQYIYFDDNTSASAFQRVANILPDTVIYSTPGNEFPYPLSYNSPISGTYYAHYNISGGTAVEAGIVSGSADGTGTLTSPLGTFSNVLRTHTIRNEKDTVVITGTGTFTGTTVVNYYDWYQPNSYYPILQYAVTNISIPPVLNEYVTSVGYRMGYASSAVNDISADNTGWMVYPNPASTQATVIFQAGNTGKTDITLYDVSGRSIQQLSSDNTSGALQTMQLNLENVPAGISMITIKNNNGMATRKLEVSR